MTSDKLDNEIAKDYYKCYLNGMFYGSGDINHIHELFKDYVITCKMYGRKECTFKVVGGSSDMNLTIEELLEKLDKYDDDKVFKFSNGKFFNGDFDSYRGYYKDLCIGYSDEDQGFNTVGKLKEVLSKALKQGVMYGYKGGEYPITLKTLVWLSNYREVSDYMIVDVLELEGQLYIIIKEEE